MSVLKSPREIALMAEAGRIVDLCFQKLTEVIRPGVTTLELNDLCDTLIRQEGAVPASLGYEGFPYAVCVSVNDELVHGFASRTRHLQEGDIVSVDIVVKKNGYHADAARTYPVGRVDEKALHLLKVTKDAFEAGLEHARAGARVGDISHAIQTLVEKNGYNVARDYTGHGIGTAMHEDPYIPNFGNPGTGPLLKEGMTIAIEPMVLTGKADIRIDHNGWTARSKDGRLTAHHENTIAITHDGPKILTAGEGSVCHG